MSVCKAMEGSQVQLAWSAASYAQVQAQLNELGGIFNLIWPGL